MRWVATMIVVCGALAAPAAASAATTPEQDAYAARFLLVNERIVGLGERVGAAMSTAERKTDARLARQFRSFARRLDGLAADLGALTPPAEWSTAHGRLVAALPPVVAALRGISQAARDHSARKARRSTIALIGRSAALRTARRSLYRLVVRALEAP